jgi:hypothetical protein
MIYFIYGPEASGKTRLAKRAAELAVSAGNPAPLIIDDERDFSDEDPKLTEELYSREMVELNSILVSQQDPPVWLAEKFGRCFHSFFLLNSNPKFNTSAHEQSR